MMHTVLLLTNAVTAHRQMLLQINADVVDAGTSWPTALSKFFTSLGDLMRSHIEDSISLLHLLTDVYMKHVDYLVTSLSSQLQNCDTLTAEVHVITIRAQSTVILQMENDRLHLLRDFLEYLNRTLDDYDPTLNAEARKSSYQWHYFPNPLHIDDCNIAFHSLHESLVLQLDWLNSFIPTTGTIVPQVDAVVFTNMTVLRSDMERLSKCLVSYKEELESFEEELFSILTSTRESDFNYEPPVTLLPKFSLDDQWLESITSQYIASSLSKLELATVLHANGSEVLTTADRLYADIEQLLFIKLSNIIDEQETGMVSFYNGLMQRFTDLQRYMFANDTSLEEFMRHMSIWQMPIVNFQKSEVIVASACRQLHFCNL